MPESALQAHMLAQRDQRLLNLGGAWQYVDSDVTISHSSARAMSTQCMDSVPDLQCWSDQEWCISKQSNKDKRKGDA